MNNPFARIIFAVIFFLLLCGLYYLSEGTGLETLIFLVIGAVIGIPKGLALPMSFTYKLGYIFVLAGSITAITVGIRTKKNLLGQLLVFLGVAIWFACGFIGIIIEG
ncbi:MAG: hypothetical protein KKC76_12905 [Proteobacteria bacterium]|nr:hypothetical protein [Pseudomonadota bacterium]MBU4294987.1 hypothetical protein [Pseudomonadota bacterium]MCG2746661.1 hypothetical protein [Desulfobulbaceae bacterium]